MTDVGVVAIGRNEGERLRRCLASVVGRGVPVVYVDSGSRDGSVDLARSLAVEVVPLDDSVPFSAARARNEGLTRLLDRNAGIRFVQFVDGDSELVEGWIEAARQEMEAKPEVGMVCGRLRERAPRASIYNRVCEIEWDAPVGEAAECGGIAMFRVAAFREAGGFDPTVVAGEEPELCLRIRRRGWKVWRLAAEMAVHDAAVLRFAQWWRRAVRCGHAYEQCRSLHGDAPDRQFVRETRRAWLWAFVIPAAALLGSWSSNGLSLWLFLLYPAQFARIFRRVRRRGLSAGDAAAYAAACVVGKFAELVGILKFKARQFGGGPFRLIEHK